jgi:DNA-binding XRE family transcriptional regulator
MKLEEIQIIEREGKPEWAVLPYDEYLELLEQAELLEDIRDFERINAAIERGEEELIPSEIVNAILDGENPVKVWREFRGLTQGQLADAAGISKPYLSQIETGKRKGSTDILSALAKVLKVTLEEVIAREAE